MQKTLTTRVEKSPSVESKILAAVEQLTPNQKLEFLHAARAKAAENKEVLKHLGDMQSPFSRSH